MKYLLVLMGLVPLFGQTTLYLPWVPQNDLFHSSLIFNNHTENEVVIHLRAVRKTETEEVTLTLPSRMNYKAAADELFPALGSGSGYAVHIRSEERFVSASIIVSSATTASGNSPSRMQAISSKDASRILAFNYLSSENDSFAAPVVQNIAPVGTSVNFHAYQNGQELGTFNRFVLPGEAFAMEVSQLFPETSGTIYVVAKASQPIVGASFLFNQFREPALAPAIPINVVPDPRAAVSDFEFEGAGNGTSLFIEESIQLKLTGHFVQGPARELTQQANWSSSAPDIISVSNSGAKGKITAQGYGSALITATFNGYSETIEINTAAPTVKLERGMNCSQDPTICASWQTITNSSELPDVRTLVFTSANPQVLETLRITSDDSAIIISELSAKNFRASVPVSISGLAMGQRIPKGTSKVFFLEAGRTNGPEADIIYSVKAEGSGTVLLYKLRYSSN